MIEPKFQYTSTDLKCLFEGLSSILEVQERVLKGEPLKENEVSYFYENVKNFEKLSEHIKFLDKNFYGRFKEKR